VSDYGTHHDLDRKVSSQQFSLDRLEREVSSLRSTVEDLDNEDLPRKVRELESEVEENDSALRRVHSDLEEAAGDVGDHTRQIKKLTDRVAWLERHVRQNPDTRTTDFDDATNTLRAVAETVQRGLAAESTLLNSNQRNTLAYTRSRYATALEQRDGAHQRVVELCGVLASTLPQDEEHKAAATALEGAVTAARASVKQLPQLATQAEEAAEKLADDDAGRQERAAVIAAGTKAHKRLRWELRSHLDEALVGEDMLPTWFITVLGPLPPARDTQKWMEAAVEILAYRSTYKISDPVVALGDEPSAHPATERSRWYREIRRLLNHADR
jgi:chromosome segregation ATPase